VTTTVVHVDHAPYDVYVGRRYDGGTPDFGSPIRFGQPCPVCQKIHLDEGVGRLDLLECYHKWFLGKILTDPELETSVRALKDMVLGCFCSPSWCHADFLAAYADGGVPELDRILRTMQMARIFFSTLNSRKKPPILHGTADEDDER